MKNIFTILLLTCGLSSTVFATKDVSGGNGAGGTLLDVLSQGQGQLMAGIDISQTMKNALPEIYQAYPFFANIVEAYTHDQGAKLWYLEDRALNPACANPITVQVSKVEILACQNDVEVRINKPWWLKASTRDRAELLLHEILTGMRFHDEKFGAVPPAVQLLLTQPGTAATTAALYALGFGYFDSTAEMAQANQLFNTFMLSTCSVKDKRGFQAAQEKFEQTELGKAKPMVQMLISDTIYLAARHNFYGNLCQVDSDTIDYLLWQAWWDRYMSANLFTQSEWVDGPQ